MLFKLVARTDVRVHATLFITKNDDDDNDNTVVFTLLLLLLLL